MDKPHVLDILAKKQGCFVSDLRLNPMNRPRGAGGSAFAGRFGFSFEGMERGGLLPHKDNPDF